MKNFEKWAEIQRPYDPFCCHIMMEAAWEAALKWVLKDMDNCCDRFALSCHIEEELERLK